MRGRNYLQSGGKSRMAMGLLGSGSAPRRGVNLSRSRVRASFLRVEAEQRRWKEPPEDAPRSTLEVIMGGIGRCVNPWKRVG